jgi:hypothetical protein
MLVSFAAGDANLYRYVGNIPLRYTDPQGLEVFITPVQPISGPLGHRGIIVWDPSTKTGQRYDGNGPGIRKWLKGDNSFTPPAGPQEVNTLPADSIKVETGKSYVDERDSLADSFRKTTQIPEYGLDGPNSNTYAHQLLKNAEIPDPPTPPNTPGWNDGSYGKDGIWTQWDKYGNKKVWHSPPGGFPYYPTGSWAPDPLDYPGNAKNGEKK